MKNFFLKIEIFEIQKILKIFQKRKKISETHQKAENFERMISSKQIEIINLEEIDKFLEENEGDMEEYCNDKM